MGRDAYMKAMDQGTGGDGATGDNPFARTGQAAKDAKFLRKSLQGDKFKEPMSPDEEKEYSMKYGGGGGSQMASK